jgi:SOS-response transcriptional repressor LexA
LLGIEKTLTYSRYERGERKIPLDLLAIAAKIGETSVEYLLYGNPDANTEPTRLGIREIPVLDWVQAGCWAGVNSGPYPGIAEEYIDIDMNGGHLFALRVRGDSMEPDFIEGDLLVVNPDLQAEPGEYVIAKRDEENEAMFKQLKKSDDIYLLRALNPKYDDIIMRKGIRIVGKVVKTRRERKL